MATIDSVPGLIRRPTRAAAGPLHRLHCDSPHPSTPKCLLLLNAPWEEASRDCLTGSLASARSVVRPVPALPWIARSTRAWLVRGKEPRRQSLMRSGLTWSTPKGGWGCNVSYASKVMISMVAPQSVFLVSSTCFPVTSGHVAACTLNVTTESRHAVFESRGESAAVRTPESPAGS